MANKKRTTGGASLQELFGKDGGFVREAVLRYVQEALGAEMPDETGPCLQAASRLPGRRSTAM